MAICAILNFFTLFCYRRARRRASNVHQNRANAVVGHNRDKFEYKMMVYAMLVFLGQLLQAIYMVNHSIEMT
jgi:hypothetical protein